MKRQWGEKSKKKMQMPANFQPTGNTNYRIQIAIDKREKKKHFEIKKGAKKATNDKKIAEDKNNKRKNDTEH